LVQSQQVQLRLAAGDLDGARRASRQALRWIWWSLAAGLFIQLPVLAVTAWAGLKLVRVIYAIG
jgi:hypothetical protein